MLKTAIIAAIFLTGMALPAMAADKDGSYQSLGMLEQSCGNFNGFVASSDATALFETKAAMLGYITAFNQQTDDTYHVLGDHSANEAIQWLEEFCWREPLFTLSDALQVMTITFFKNRQKEAP